MMKIINFASIFSHVVQKSLSIAFPQMQHYIHDQVTPTLTLDQWLLALTKPAQSHKHRAAISWPIF